MSALRRSVLLDVWQHLAAAEDVGQALPAVRGALSAIVPINRIGIWHLEERRTRLTSVASEGPDAQEWRRPLDLSPADAALLSEAGRGRSQVAEGDGDGVRIGLIERLGRKEGWTRVVGVLVVDAEVLGLLALELDATRCGGGAGRDLVFALLEPFSRMLAVQRRLHRAVIGREAAEAERQALLQRLGRRRLSEETIVGSATGLREVMERVHQVSASNLPVMIFGQTGSGKEVIARAIHVRSDRHGAAFVRVNCGAIPPELVDSELFGHERGSFTGATNLRRGWFERADGGTLFLDEVAELSPAAQVRLLRVLQDGTFERVGGQRELHVDVRIVAATHRDLATMVDGQGFREDLWYRLAVFPIVLPSLAERLEDMAALATHFALRASHRFGLPPITPSIEDVEMLRAYHWPGNIRELAAVIDRAAILGNGRRLEIGEALGTGFRPRPAENDDPVFPTLDQVAARHIERALEETNGRIDGPRGAAEMLGVNPNTLRSRMRRLGVDWVRFRRD